MTPLWVVGRITDNTCETLGCVSGTSCALQEDPALGVVACYWHQSWLRAAVALAPDLLCVTELIASGDG